MKNTKTAAVPTVVIDGKIIEAIAYNIASTEQIQHSMSEPVDVSLPLPSSDPLLRKDTKTAAVPRVLIDATNIEAIAYNIASTAQIQHSISEPVDVSLPLPSSHPLLMKDTRTAAVSRVVIDATNIEAIACNIAWTAQIQPSMSQPIDVSLPVPRVRIDAKTIEAIVYNRAAKPPIQPSADPSLMKYTKTTAVPWSSIPRTLKPSPTTSLRRRMAQMTTSRPVPALLAHRCAAVFDAANWDKL
ncbi:hypothetical protein QYE76_024457 [Lolium multiflorum]|uniref:Uncharacterized protein n=1 Tax=Lolium multiflorum TaxID=4521 RepID=A0AAD8RDQ4_LOLMU|nr:hypothetical protein QYE76_024457 [Lolium multiflorum]